MAIKANLIVDFLAAFHISKANIKSKIENDEVLEKVKFHYAKNGFYLLGILVNVIPK
jgi:hypothetical protein